MSNNSDPPHLMSLPGWNLKDKVSLFAASKKKLRPVGWGCRICRLHLYGTPWWVGSIVNETQTFFMAYENITQAKTKKMKRPLTESENENKTDENFYQFIVLESIEETPITKLSPFLIQKTIETLCKPINIKKAMNNTIILQTTNQKQSEKILKWKQSGKLNIKTYPHPTLNFSKGVIKSPDFALCSFEEIRLRLKPQGVTDVRRISIRKETKTIDTNTYILTFNKPTTPTSIRIGYINTKIETYIPNPLRYQKCQKYGHPKEKCT